jgi:hypothetical protein
MPNLLKLSDCDFEIKVSQEPRGDLEIRMMLPGVIDVRDVPFKRDYCSDHDHCRNEFGDLFYDCSRHASFYPPVALKRYSIAEYFESVDRSSKLDTFRISQCAFKEKLRVDMSKNDIIQTIQSEIKPSMYMNYFFNWINKFIETYGEDHFRTSTFPSMIHLMG